MSIFSYLDWNVFNKIDKVQQLEVDEKLIYSKIKSNFHNGDITMPYPNALNMVKLDDFKLLRFF
jgi:hypothetical protein